MRDLEEHVFGPERAALEPVGRQHSARVARRPADAVALGVTLCARQLRGLVEGGRKLLKLDLVCGGGGYGAR